MNRPRALFLAPEEPALGTGGGGLRSASLLAYLKRTYEVEVATLHLPPHSRAMPARVWRNAVRLVKGRPPLFDRYSGHESQIAAAMRAPRYELAVVEHFWCASYADLLRSRCGRLVLDLHNIESQLARSHAEATRGPASWASARFAKLYESLEAEWIPRFDTLLVTSAADQARVRHPRVLVFPNALPEIPLPEAAASHTSNVIAFSGNLEYHPNVEAVRWFAAAIWPLLLEQTRQRYPDLEWRLIGRNPEAVAHLIKGLQRVRLTGPVDDAVAALAAAKVCVVPLLSGSGTRFKILEAWAAGRAVVSTTLGAEGLGAISGEHLLIADDPGAFAGAVVRLLDDAELRSQLGAAGRARYLAEFTWEAAWRRLEEAGGL